MIETFEGISDGVAVTTSNSGFTDAPVATAGGTGLAETTGGGPLTSTFLRVSLPATAYWSISYAGTASGAQWSTFFIRPDSIPTVNLVLAKGYIGSTTISECLRAVTGASLTFSIRDNATTRWTSSAITVGEWHRVAVMLDPANDQCRLKIYSGANLLSSTASQDSGLQTLSQVSATTVDTWRIGCVSGATDGWQVDYDDVHLGEASEWFPTVGEAHYVLSSTCVADSTTIDEWVVDATTSAGTVTLTQTSGTTATVVESPTGVFTVTNPSGTDVLQFDLAAVAAGVTDTAAIALSRGASGRPTVLVKTSAGWK